MGTMGKTVAIIAGLLLTATSPLKAGPCPPFYGITPFKQKIKAFFMGGNIWQAVEANNIKKAKKLVTRHPQLANEPRYDRRLPLCLAKSPAMVDVLVAAGADVNKKAERCHCPLLFQSRHGRAAVVKRLLEKGAKIETKGYMQGYTALHHAAYYDYLEVAKVLVDAGAKVTDNRSYLGNDTPLMVAANRGSEKVFAYLLSKDENPHLNKLLHIASEYGGYSTVRCGNENIVKLCLAAGADVNSDVDYSPALHKAAKLLSSSMVQLLLKEGADITARDRDGKTAIELIDGDYFRSYHPGLYKKTRDILVEYWNKVPPGYERPKPAVKAVANPILQPNAYNDDFDGFMDF